MHDKWIYILCLYLFIDFKITPCAATATHVYASKTVNCVCVLCVSTPAYMYLSYGAVAYVVCLCVLCMCSWCMNFID